MKQNGKTRIGLHRYEPVGRSACRQEDAKQKRGRTLEFHKRLAALLLAALLAAGLPTPALAAWGADASAPREAASGPVNQASQNMTLLGSSGDAYVYFDQSALMWTFGNGQVEKTVQFDGGSDTTKKFTMTSFINRLAGDKEYILSSAPADEFAVRWNEDNSHLEGGKNYWQYQTHSVTTGAQGELLLSITMSYTGDYPLDVTRHYQVLSDTGVIEEWTDFTNTGGDECQLSELRILRARLMGAYADDVDFYYMTGDKLSDNNNRHILQPPMTSAELSSLKEYSGFGADTNQPFGALRNREDQDGIFFTWDYTGGWTAKVGNNSGRFFLQVSTTAKSFTDCAGGGTLTSPVGRVGLFVGDLDDMGNQITDYQYKYRWEYTNNDYMNLIRFGGYGYSSEILMNKIEANRYIGGDMLWIDDGWQEAIGDWNWSGDRPLEEMREYLEKNGQLLGLWLVPWGVNLDSQLYEDHPEWSVYNSVENPSTSSETIKKYGLRVELPAVLEYVKQMLNEKQQELGTFMLKPDFNQNKEAYSRAMAVMDILASFKQSNPTAGLHLCSDGGGLLNPGSVAYSELLLLQDGTPALSDGYWVSMLYPMDKLLTVNGRGNIGAYSKTNRALLSSAMTVAASSADASATQEQLEPIRQDCDLYRYLRTQGVMGRYVKVYRPVTSDTANTYYFIQKMSQDAGKGYITVRFSTSLAGNSLTVYPKGLVENMSYTVSTLEGGMTAPETKTGAEWMASGIQLRTLKIGEVIFLNLENRPGAGTDMTAPASPTDVTTAPATYMTVSGIEVTWTAGSDNNWISYYEIEKNGEAYDKVSAGTFYFDRYGTAEDVYRVRTVDGDGNVSDYVPLADKSALQALYDANKNKEQGSYTDASWAAFAQALQAAGDVLDDDDAAQAEIDGAVSALRAAIDGLTKKAEPEPPSYPPSNSYVPFIPDTSSLPVHTAGQGSSLVTTTTTAIPTASIQNGKASATVTTSMGSEIVRQAVDNDSENVVIAPNVTGSVTKTEVSIPASTVGQIGSQTNASLTVSTPMADVTIPKTGLGSLSSPGGTVTVTAEQTGRTMELSITAGGRSMESIPGGVTLTAPVANATPGTVAVLIYEDGTREVIRKSMADDGRITVPLEGSAKLEIVDNSKYFADVPSTSWAADAVAFVSAHELFNGTGTNQFSPELPMSRGMLAVVLHNLESNPIQALTGIFSDVGSNAWYAEGVAWAVSNGIVNGYGNGQFGPNDSITREQLAVMLWRYAGSPAAAHKELYFTDADQASEWALEALCWATENGVVNGRGNGILDPAGQASRAETAQMLMNFAGR